MRVCHSPSSSSAVLLRGAEEPTEVSRGDLSSCSFPSDLPGGTKVPEVDTCWWVMMVEGTRGGPWASTGCWEEVVIWAELGGMKIPEEATILDLDLGT